jgi:hypothetical protein
MTMMFVMLGMLLMLPKTKPIVFVWYDSSQSVLNYYMEVQALVSPDILNGGSGQEEAATSRDIYAADSSRCSSSWTMRSILPFGPTPTSPTMRFRKLTRQIYDWEKISQATGMSIR